jgi:hypothetical protein
MKVFSIVVATFCIVLGLATSAFADTKNITVKPNSSKEVLTYYIHSGGDGCFSTSPGAFLIRQKPSNGTVTFARKKTKLNDPGKVCHGKTVHYTSVTYTPNKGFKGTDSFSVGNNFYAHDGDAHFSAHDYSYNVTVK